MIISCPECAGPFELEDSRIAALVQIECPHCSFRMILDFGAANDASLLEEGMRMASGFRSAADYFASVAAPAAEPVAPEPAAPEPVARRPAVVPAPSPRPVPTSQPISAPRAAAVAPTKPPRTKTVVGPFPAPPPAQGPVSGGELDYEDEPPTMLHRAAADEPEAPAPAPAAVREAASAEPRAPRMAASDLAVSAASRATVEVDPPVLEAAARAAADRAPPHTPPTRATTSVSADSGPMPAADRSVSESGEDLTLGDDERPRSSPMATAGLVVLLLVVLGLVGASVALEGTPDPRPLLEDLYRQFVK
jgi:DNA-directed RNA polymerase subunit RPC12/RpoP